MQNEPQAQAEQVTPATTPESEPSITTLTPQDQHEQLASLLSDPAWEPESGAQAVAAAAPVEGRAPTEDDIIEDQPPAPSEVQPLEEEPSSSSQRFRFQDPADRQFATLRKEGVDPAEAARIAYGIGAAPKASTAETAAAADVDPLTSRQQELAEVDEQLTALGAEEGVMNSEVVELIRRRTDLATEITFEQRSRHQRAAQAEQARTQAQRSIAAKVAERFPDLADKGSQLRVEADRLFQQFQGTPMMAEVDAPIQLAEMAALKTAKANAAANGTHWATELAKLEKGAAAKPLQPAKATASLTPKVTPASGAKGTRVADRALTEEEQFHQGKSSDPKEEYHRLARLLTLPSK